MSNEEQDPERSVEPDLVDPDAVVLDEGTISAEALEPELSVSPDTLHLQEPALEPVEISRDTAEAASLEDAAAEARAVAAEAEKAGTLVGGPMPTNTPTADAAPDGTAPAGGKAGDAPDGATATGPGLGGTHALPDDTSSTAPEAPADTPAPDEILADATSGTTEHATPHPTPDEVIAGTRGTTEHSTPHPTPDEVIAGTSESASAGATRHTSIGTGAEVENGTMSSAAASDDLSDSGGPNQGVGEQAIAPRAGSPATGGAAVPSPGAERTRGSHAAGTADQRASAHEGNTTTPADGQAAADGSEAARSSWVPRGTHPEDASDPEGQTRRDHGREKSSNTPLLLLVGGGVVVLGLIVWLLVSLLGGSGDEDRVDPSSLAAGECLAEFTDITEDARLVDCTEPHNAQLVASESYPDEAEFPGRDQLGLRAESACATASANVDPDVVADVEVSLLRATPTTDTWTDGDRRVDCFAVVENEETLSRSMLNS